MSYNNKISACETLPKEDIKQNLIFEHLNPTHCAESQLNELVNVSRQTFIETFGSVYTESDTNHYLQERLTLERLHWEVTQEPNTFFYLLKSVHHQAAGQKNTSASEVQSPRFVGSMKLNVETIWFVLVDGRRH